MLIMFWHSLLQTMTNTKIVVMNIFSNYITENTPLDKACQEEEIKLFMFPSIRQLGRNFLSGWITFPIRFTCYLLT